MVLPEPRRSVAVLFQDLADSGALRTDDGVIARVAGGQFADDAIADRVVVTAGNQRSPRRRTKRSGAVLRVAQARSAAPIQAGRRNDTAQATRDAIALVI